MRDNRNFAEIFATKLLWDVIILTLECIDCHQVILFFRDTFFLFNFFQVRKYSIYEKLHGFWGTGPVIFRERHWKWFWEVEFRRNSFRFPIKMACVGRKSLTALTNFGLNMSLIINPFNWYVFASFKMKWIFSWWDITWGSLI